MRPLVSIARAGTLVRERACVAALVLALVCIPAGVWAPSAHAAPPVNDNYANAITIPSGGGTYIGDVTEATVEVGEPATGSGVRKTIWYKWTPPAGTWPITIDDKVGGLYADRYPSLDMFRHTGAATTWPITNIGHTYSYYYANPTWRTLYITADGLTTYYFNLSDEYGSSTTNYGNIRLCVGVPCNDAVAEAYPLSMGTASTTAITSLSARIGATRDASDTAETSPHGTTWYTFTAAGPFYIDSLDPRNNDSDTILTLYQSNNPSTLGTPVASNDDYVTPGGNLPGSRIYVSATQTRTYWLAVVQKTPTSGAFYIRSGTTPSSNDHVQNAVTITGATGSWTGDTTNLATPEFGESSLTGGYTGTSLWYKWTAPATGRLLLETNGVSDNHRSRVYALPPGETVATLPPTSNMTHVRTGATSFCGAPEGINEFAVTSGITYYIAVEGASSTNGSPVNISWRMNTTAPANDNFANRTVVTSDTATMCGDNFYATDQTASGEPTTHDGAPSSTSVWYEWNPLASGLGTIEITTGSSYPLPSPRMAVYTGTGLASLTPIVATFGTKFEYSFNKNTTYYIAVASNTSGNGEFNLVFNASPPYPNPVIDAVSPNADIDYTNDNSGFDAWWGPRPAASGISSYHWCLYQTTSTAWLTSTCTGALVQGNVPALDASNHTIRVNSNLADGRYAMCVSAVTGYRPAYYHRCSDGLTIDTVAPVMPIPNDGPSASVDADFQASLSQLQATWPAATDATSGIGSYDVCFTTSASGADCATGALSTWTSTTATTRTQTGLTLSLLGTFYACVRAIDRAGNVSSVRCSDGIQIDQGIDDPTNAIDGSGADEDAWYSTSDWTISFTGITDTPAGVARYEWCLATSVDCSAGLVFGWTSGGTSTTVSRTGLTLVNLTWYYACVRAVDNAGNISNTTCTDGAQVIDAGPTPPTVVNDGPTVSIDRDWQNDTTTLAATWPSATDGAGIKRHEYCIASGPSCSGTKLVDWTTASLSGGLALSSGGHSLAHGSTWYVAVRGVNNNDVIGNPRSSDGVTIDTVRPGGVTSDIATQVTSGDVLIEWDPATDDLSGVASYWVYRSTSAGLLGSLVNGPAGTIGLSFTDQTLSTPGVYHYTVLALDNAGNLTDVGSNQPSVTFFPRYYLRNTASALLGSTSKQLQTTPGSAAVTAAGSRVNNTGYVEFRPGVLAYNTYLPAPPVAATARGWVFETPMTGTTIPAANWRLNITTETAKVHGGYLMLRAWKLQKGSPDSYVLVSDWTEGTVDIGATTGATQSTVEAVFARMTFAANEYLYIELAERIATSATGNNPTGIRVDTASEYLELVSPLADTSVSAPTPVLDGATPGLDVQQQVSGSTISATWPAVFDYNDIDRYEYCITTTSSGCGSTPLVPWTSVGATTQFTHGGLTLASGTRYYACVRSWDMVGNYSPGSCSDGVMVDAIAPTPPAPVNDGATAPDHTWRTATPASLSANWSASTDAETGVSHYDLCFTTTASGSDCAAGAPVTWTYVGNTLAATLATTPLNGSTYYACVRAVDMVGNTGTASCSNGITVDTTPPAPGIVLDIVDPLPGDQQYTSSLNTIAASWTVATDTGSGIVQYEWCVATATTAGTCSGTTHQAYTNVGLAQTASTSALTLANGSTYYVCVRATNGAGLQAGSCSNGITVDRTAPVITGLIDGSAGADEQYRASTSTWAARWTSVTDAAGVGTLEYCISDAVAGGDCTGTIETAWTALTPVSVTSLASSGHGFIDATTYYTCLRATDVLGNVGRACSNGDTIDVSPPVLGAVLDGTGADIDTQFSHTSLSANWPMASDVSGVQSYGVCFSTDPTGADCAAGALVPWTNVGTALTRTSPANLATGTTYYACVRATDMLAQVSGATCSDGVMVLNQTPNAPTGTAQFRADGTTTIPNGAASVDGNTTRVVLSVTASDPDPSEQLVAWVEVIPTASTFSATCGTSIAGVTFASALTAAPTAGAAVTMPVDVTGLAINTTYKWRSCVVDQSLAASAWTSTASALTFRVVPLQVTAITPDTIAAGSVNRTLTITGAAIDPDAAVSVTLSGGAPDPDLAVTAITWLSSTSIQVTVTIASGASLATRDITVTNVAAGGSATLPDALTVVAPTIIPSISTLGYHDTARDVGGIDFGQLPAGSILQIGPAGSGQTLAGPAIEFSVATDVPVDVSFRASDITQWTGMPIGQLGLRQHATSGAWIPTSTTATPLLTVAPGSPPTGWDLQLDVPGNAGPGTKQATVDMIVLPTV